jgi:uncharacterized protein YidB (DUF937 family)
MQEGRHASEKQQASDLLRILHGARGLPPAEAAEALGPFLESMRKSGSGDALDRLSRPRNKPRKAKKSGSNDQPTA